MKSTTYKIIILSMIFAFSTNLMAQQNDVRTEVLLLDYLTGYCDVGEEITFIDFIQDNAQTVQPALIVFVKKGVPDKMIDSLQANLIRQYNERQKLLSQDLNFGLSEGDIELVRSESQKEFNDRMVQEFRDGFMTQAIFGLSLIDTEEAQALVNQIASDESHPYQRAAQNAANKVYLKQK